MRAVCAGTRRDGTPCTANAPAGERYCYHHDPARAQERRESARRAATLKHSSLAKDLREMREFVWELLEYALSGRLPAGVGKRLAEVVQLLQCFLRAAELEMRAAEEPLRADLDVRGLREQVLRRVEELEERERGREEILSKMVPAMEARGYDTGAVRAVMGG